MKRILLFMGIAAAFAMSSCSPFTLVNSETYNNADLADYHTFRIVTPDEGKLPEGMEMVTYYNIAAAIREQMVDRGFVEDPASNLLINIAVTTQREIATAPLTPPAPPAPPAGYFPFNGPYYPAYVYPRYLYGPYYPPTYPNAQVITGIYKEGVLTMDMVNLQEKLPLFSASVATIINNGSGQYRNLKEIAEAVQELFSKFPVPLLPQYRK